MRKFIVLFLALTFILSSALAETTILIDLAAEGTPISPLIYGINNFTDAAVYEQVTATAVRQGGNRMSAYNWETNASNAGSDWYHSSDTHMSSSPMPAQVAKMSTLIAHKFGIPYRMTTLQLAGYVSADTNGTVTEAQTAPSARWIRVEPAKGSAFAKRPDTRDGVVYMDEYVHYLIGQLGDAASEKGIQAYSLDNEPALWNHTHSRVHPEMVQPEELMEKSIATAKAVKAVDPHAEIYGPALYGYTAYDHLADEASWKKIQQQKGYRWFLDYYLDEMRQAEAEHGLRLLDVLDIHYYSESARVGGKDRLQAVRTLYEKGFRENSWIGQWCQNNLPLLPTIQASIDKYYPGTKLAITEYNYGGEDITATIAQAETLGCFAANQVYSAFIWGGNAWQYAGINLYTNFDGQGGAFGETLLPAQAPDHSRAVAYAARRQDGSVTVMITNKTESAETFRLAFAGKNTFSEATVYAVTADSASIVCRGTLPVGTGNSFTVELPAMCAAMLVFQ